MPLNKETEPTFPSYALYLLILITPPLTCPFFIYFLFSFTQSHSVFFFSIPSFANHSSNLFPPVHIHSLFSNFFFFHLLFSFFSAVVPTTLFHFLIQRLFLFSSCQSLLYPPTHSLSLLPTLFSFYLLLPFVHLPLFHLKSIQSSLPIHQINQFLSIRLSDIHCYFAILTHLTFFTSLVQTMPMHWGHFLSLTISPKSVL